MGSDIPKNGILICHKHHSLAERYIIKAKDLIALLVEYYKYTYTEEEMKEIDHPD